MPLYLIITHGFLVIVNIYKICIVLGIIKSYKHAKDKLKSDATGGKITLILCLYYRCLTFSPLSPTVPVMPLRP